MCTCTLAFLFRTVPCMCVCVFRCVHPYSIVLLLRSPYIAPADRCYAAHAFEKVSPKHFSLLFTKLFQNMVSRSHHAPSVGAMLCVTIIYAPRQVPATNPYPARHGAGHIHTQFPIQSSLFYSVSLLLPARPAHSLAFCHFDYK